MSNTSILSTAAALMLASAPMAWGQSDDMGDNPTVGGAPMMADMNIIENAVNSPIHTTLVAAVQAADLVETLQGPGPFTVFAPTDAAFDMITDESLNALLQPEAKDAADADPDLPRRRGRGLLGCHRRHDRRRRRRPSRGNAGRLHADGRNVGG